MIHEAIITRMLELGLVTRTGRPSSYRLCKLMGMKFNQAIDHYINRDTVNCVWLDDILKVLDLEIGKK